MSPPPNEPKSPRRRGGLLRMLLEAAAMLTISVSLFRSFVAQGYMIETGSMAPGLWGYHRRAVCPACRYPFSVGESRAVGSVRCPNCGSGGIDVESLSRNDGDQLLVNRIAFDYLSPKRWGVVVFRNPSEPEQAYVKRLAGLPGESLQIIRGDLYIGQRIQPKPLSVQRGMRIPVYDHNYVPEDRDPDWQPRWVIEQPGGGWESHGTQFGFDDASLPTKTPTAAAGHEGPPGDIELTSATQPAQSALRDVSLQTIAAATPPQGLRYVSYRHWIRTGGAHRTSVPLAAWPMDVPPPEPAVDILEYNPQKRRLVCRGALPADRRDELLKDATPEFRKAVEELYEGSHLSPILDTCGYNGADLETGRREVRDLCLALRLAVSDGEGEFAVGISDGTQSFECRFQFDDREIHVVQQSTGQVLQKLPLPGVWPGAAEIELSLMDQQLSLAVDGRELYSWNYPNPLKPGRTPWRPAWFGARTVAARVSDVRLYRDVYYTGVAGGRGYGEPVKLGPAEYFVLGDNSPVSRDSRSWHAGHVLTGELLLGKPFVVHLPSVRRTLQLGSWRTEIRIPEFARMRYIY